MSHDATPLVDLSTVNAVQSLFDGAQADPWASTVGSEFVDLIVWNSRVKFPAVQLERRDASPVSVPRILSDMQRRESGAFSLDVYSLSEPRVLQPHLIGSAVREFGTFVASNKSAINSFLRLHSSSWINQQKLSRGRGGNHYAFDLGNLREAIRADPVASGCGVSDEDFAYLLDLVLKYLVYAEQATGRYYLTHPIRRAQPFRYLSLMNSPIGPSGEAVPFRVGPYLLPAAQRRGIDWFTSSLYEVRQFIEERNLRDLSYPGNVSPEVLRELSARLELPARLRGYSKLSRAANIGSAVTGISGSVLSSNPWPAVTGSVLTLATTVWSGQVPGPMASISWMQWMFEWPLEIRDDT